MKGRIAEFGLRSTSCKTRISSAFSRQPVLMTITRASAPSWRSIIRKNANKSEGATVLDLGCGTGYFLSTESAVRMSFVSIIRKNASESDERVVAGE